MRLIKNTGKLLIRALLALAVALLTLWGVMALYYSDLPGASLRTAAAAVFGCGALAAFALAPGPKTLLRFAAVFLGVFVWWSFIAPSHDREWHPLVARLPNAVWDGDRVTIRNIRDFDYRSEHDFTVRYRDRTYDLSQLQAVDLALTYWGGNRSIAHSMLSFGFSGDKWLTLSIETRSEIGEEYSAIAGFFKQYELIYVLAEERDVLGLRAIHRGDELYLYPLTMPPENGRVLLRALLDEVNHIHTQPAFYNALSANCTTALLAVIGHLPNSDVDCDYRLLLNGYLDQRVYDRGRLPADSTVGLPYDEMRAAHRATDIVREIGADPQFSRLLREQLPPRVR